MVEDKRFAMVPLAANRDPRLSLRQLKTLIAICSFRKSADDFCIEAGRDEIASRCGFNSSTVSTATTELQRLGWLVKQGAGGRAAGGAGLKTIYTITVPETVSLSGTVAESETVLKSGTVAESTTVPDSATPTVPDSGTPLYTKKVNRDGRVSKPSNSEPAGFADCWLAYPKRDGGNSRADALKAYRGRLKAGASPADLLAGVKRYAAYCTAKGIIGTEYVKQASRFFGTGNHWQESWDSPSATPTAEQKPKAGDSRVRHGVAEVFNDVAGWVLA